MAETKTRRERDGSHADATVDHVNALLTTAGKGTLDVGWMEESPATLRIARLETKK